VGARYDGSRLKAGDLTAFLRDFILNDPRNRLPEYDHVPIFDPPLVGVASAGDPLFEKLAEPGVVGPIHTLPRYWLPEAASVVSYFLPFSKEIKRAYVPGLDLPPLEWVSGRLNGEMFNNVLRMALTILLEKAGGRAVAPCLRADYKAVNWLPMWSERHVAHVAGLGTFGLHAGLLTTLGAAGRIGSVVTDIPLRPLERPYESAFEYCPFFTGGCGACLKRCPVGAIGPEGKDHAVCVSFEAERIRPAYKGFGYHSCGFCQNNLPCSDGLPGRPGDRESARDPAGVPGRPK
jgi:epoxyqueuosine reductase QueG